MTADPSCFFFELLSGELEVPKRLAIELEPFGLIGGAYLIILVGKELLLELRGFENVFELDSLLFSFAILLHLLHLQSPIVVFAIAKDCLHILKRIFVKATCIHNVAHASSSRGPSNFGILLLTYALILVFGIVILNKVVKLVRLSSIIGPGELAFTSILFVVGEHVSQPRLLVDIVISVAAL